MEAVQTVSFKNAWEGGATRFETLLTVLSFHVLQHLRKMPGDILQMLYYKCSIQRNQISRLCVIEIGHYNMRNSSQKAVRARAMFATKTNLSPAAFEVDYPSRTAAYISGLEAGWADRVAINNPVQSVRSHSLFPL